MNSPAKTDTPLIRLAPGQHTCGPVGVTIRDMKRGEQFLPHIHLEERHNHFTVVARGSLVCHGRPAIEGEVLRVGDVIDWVVGEPHAMTALEDDTRVVQIRKGPWG